jgi:hypothetical protein
VFRQALMLRIETQGDAHCKIFSLNIQYLRGIYQVRSS